MSVSVGVEEELAVISRVPASLAASARRLAELMDQTPEAHHAASASRELRQVMADARRLGAATKDDPVETSQQEFRS